MPPETPTDFTSLAVAMGEVRATLTAGFTSVNERLDKLTTASEAHGDTLQRHEIDIQLLKSREQPKKGWTEVVGGLANILGIVTGAGTLIVGFAVIAPLLAKLG